MAGRVTRAAAHSAATVDSRKRARPALMYRPVPPGVVEVERTDNQWWLVAIGRDQRTKRFRLTRGEAAELVRVLRERVLTLDGEP